MWDGVSRKIQYLPFRASCYCFRDNVGVLVKEVSRWRGRGGTVRPIFFGGVTTKDGSHFYYCLSLYGLWCLGEVFLQARTTM